LLSVTETGAKVIFVKACPPLATIVTDFGDRKRRLLQKTAAVTVFGDSRCFL